jgi:hypothetical protein
MSFQDQSKCEEIDCDSTFKISTMSVPLSFFGCSEQIRPLDFSRNCYSIIISILKTTILIGHSLPYSHLVLEDDDDSAHDDVFCGNRLNNRNSLIVRSFANLREPLTSTVPCLCRSHLSLFFKKVLLRFFFRRCSFFFESST